MVEQISAKQVNVQLQGNTVLDNISFDLDGKKIYGLLGRNGAGKTTLLSVLAAFRKANGGEMMLDGESVFENAELMERVIFIRDEKWDDETDKVKDYIKGVALFRPNFDNDYAERLMKRFKLPEDQTVSNLSKGMQSALQAVIGLASRAPVTIFDEVYLGMDAPAREIFYEEVLQDFIDNPRIMILSTHLISEMEQLFEEVIMLDDGEVLLHEEADELRNRGVTVTGPKEQVMQFAGEKQILHEQELGGTKSVSLYGNMSDADIAEAKRLNLVLTTITLQQLFIHLTKEDGE
ncbi:ABC transporter ATP-binding protein [Gracilibacillus caseinilyticus]|uniref:ABC transporter ATP-binding protein n=1 Tax=Gracilibacillus caseinilyticus TaxID=2932256 RepID=A0ABY4F1H9_9BACI|nr:ABC transporter ATP-binding protein [Gracilibacillus caseinilyticus]UOQ50060.1 ABC transporter ATP-binding protein [Gracilibacillus caseinilyticus]